MSNIPIEVNTGETKTITFHTAGTFNTEDIVFSISAAGGDANTTLSGVAYCSTTAATAAKTATMPGFELVTGQRILLQTTNTNSATSNVTLSVNGTTAKPIKIGTANPTASNFLAGWWIANYDGTNWVLTRIYLSDENTTQTYASASDYTYWRPLVIGYSAGSEGFTPSTKTDNTYTFKTITCQPSSGTIRAGSFKVIGGTSSKFLKADGTLDENTYSLSSHDHSGVYKPIQTAVSDPSVPESGTTTSTTFIDTISQDTNGVITATKKNLPAYLSAVSALSATPAASLSDKTLTFKQFSQATSAQVSTADSSTKLYFNTAPTATNKIATMSDVNSAFQANDAMVFKGTLGTGGTATSLPATHYQGWTYKVITAGTWAGVTCEVGDMVICITDGTSANNAHWTVVQSNIDGAVTGPASSASGNVVTFNGTTGKLIQDSGFTIGKSVPSNAEFTDTKVTSSANHYTPETASGQNKSASASGGSAAWSIDVVKGVTLNTDGKGHVTGISVTSGKLPSNPNTDTKVSQSSTTTANYRKVLLAHNSNASAGADVVTETDVVYGAKLVEVQPSTGTLRANAFVKVDGSALQFLKADGSVDSSKYALESHNHDGDYQPVGNYKTTQTAVSDPSVPTSGITTSTSFIDTISQNTNGVITVTKKNLPTASTTVAGITTVGASGGAAAYSHTHSYASSSHTHGNITNAGALQSTGVDIANNDCLVVTDASNSAKVAKTTTVFDGSTTSQFLTKKGTFESLPTASTTAAGITTVGASGGAASYGHDHNGVYQPVGNYKTTQTAVSSPTAGTTTASAFIDTISQDTNGVITATKSPIPQDMVYIETAAGTKAKTATVPWTYTLNTGNVFPVVLKTSSTVAAATLSINGTTAKPVYIDGAAATASNWTAGTYLCYYNGTNYYMYTDRSPFQDKKVTPVALSSTGTTNYNILLAYSTTPTTNGQPNYATTAKINGKGEITATKFKLSSGTGFLKADGSVDSNTYSTSNHTHSGYKTTQTAVSDPSVPESGTTTSTTFIDTISQNANGVITATKKNLPTASTSTAGIIKIGTTETTAAAGNHTHTFESLTSKPTTLAGYGITDATDTKVTQTVTASSNSSWRPLIIGGSFSDATTFAPSTTTTTTYATHLAKFKPSTGVLGIVGLNKMNTNGTVADGSNNKLWNTNGGTTTIATVATSGSYSDLSNKPPIPTMMSELTNDVGYTDNIGTVTSVKVGTTSYNPSNGVVSLPAYPTNTDTTVTDADHHYSPSTVSGEDKTATASGATAAWSIDVVKGVTLNTDGKGHVTGISVTSGKIPDNPNTDTKVTQTYASASGYTYWRPLVIGYSAGSEGFTPSTATNTTYTFSTLTCQPSTGTIRAKSFKVIGGTSSQFLKADGSVDSTSYVTSDTKASSVVVGPTSSTDVNTDSTGSCFVNVVNSDNSVATGVKIIGSGSVSVSSSHDGIITITGTSGSDVTLPSSNITLSTSAQTYITSGSTTRKIALPSTDPYTSARTPSSHTHGNIQNGGTLQTTDVTIANGDKLVVTDFSNSSKIARTSIEFDGSTTTQFLSKKGTWETVQGGSGSLPSSIPSSWLGTTATTAAAGNHTHNNYISSIKAVATDGVDGSENAQSTSNVYLNIVSTNGDDTTTVLSSNKISGSGTVSVSSNSDGDITITGTGGSGGADVTIPNSDITIGTTANTYITVNSTSRKIKLPTKPPSGWLGTSSDTASKGTHSHGTITNGGYIKGNDVQSGGVSIDQVQIANGDRIVIGDFSGRSSNIYHPLKLTSIAFDGITATQFLSKKGTWETPITPLATPVATDEDDGIGMEGSVLPVDSISGTSGIVGTKYEISQNFNVAILRPDTSRDGIAFLLPICMDESGHLFLPISESFSNILVNNGYVTSYLDNI